MEDSISLTLPSGAVFKRVPRSEVKPDQQYITERQEYKDWEVIPLIRDFEVANKTLTHFLIFKRVSEREFTYDSYQIESQDSSIRNP